MLHCSVTVHKNVIYWIWIDMLILLALFFASTCPPTCHYQHAEKGEKGGQGSAAYLKRKLQCHDG